MLGWALSLLGYAYFLLGDTATAVQKAEKGLRIQNNAEFEVFSSLLNWVLGVIYSDLGDMSNAMAFIKKALELAQKNQEAAYEGLSWIWLGKILGKTDSMQTVKAENCFIFGINKLEKLKLKTYYSQGYLFLGEFYYELGQTARALEYIQKAATLFQKMGMDFWFARTQAALKKMN
jgi:tetratricopeptide (TPR) repeat protein